MSWSLLVLWQYCRRRLHFGACITSQVSCIINCNHCIPHVSTNDNAAPFSVTMRCVTHSKTWLQAVWKHSSYNSHSANVLCCRSSKKEVALEKLPAQRSTPVSTRWISGHIIILLETAISVLHSDLVFYECNNGGLVVVVGAAACDHVDTDTDCSCSMVVVGWKLLLHLPPRSPPPPYSSARWTPRTTPKAGTRFLSPESSQSIRSIMV